MKHNISITTIEALLINKALGMDMQNEVDNAMAELLKQKINNIVEYDLKDNRCDKCNHYVPNVCCKARGQCMLRSGYGYKDIRYGRTRACKKFFEPKKETL